MPRITIADIATRAGVSTGAVSYALNNRPGVSDETRRRIIGIASDLGWSPAPAGRAAQVGRTQTFGMVLARDPATLGTETFHMQFLAGLESELSKRSFALLLQVVPDLDAELDTYDRWQAARRVDGLIVIDPRRADPRIELLETAGAVPAVVAGHPSLAGGLASVWIDDAAAVRESVRYLHALGHRRVARVSGLTELGHTVLRNEAFRDEVAALDMVGLVEPSDYTAVHGAGATRRLLTAEEPPTAVIFDNDVMAVAALGVARELGIQVPEEISIIAWDDSPLCEVTYPRLSALSHDVFRFGAHVARRLFERLDGEPVDSFLDSVPVLRPRGTTARSAR